MLHHNLTTITTRRMGRPKEFALCHAMVQNWIALYQNQSWALHKILPSLSFTKYRMFVSRQSGMGPISWYSRMEP